MEAGVCHQLSAAWAPPWLVLTALEGAVGQVLQVTVVLHVSKTPGHKCLMVCGGVDTVDRVRLISAHAFAEPTRSFSMHYQTALYLPCTRFICAASSAPSWMSLF